MSKSQIMQRLSKDTGVLVLEFHTDKETNPFSNALMEELTGILSKVDSNPAISSVVLYGGKGKSFCAGGRFEEVQNMRDKATVEAWIDRVVHLYNTSLSVKKPVVAAVDHNAIGIGFQIALTADLRVGTKDTKFIMPELLKGIAAPLANEMLDYFFAHGVAMDIILKGQPVGIQKAQDIGLLHYIATSDELLQTAIDRAIDLSSRPQVPSQKTKSIANSKLIKLLTAALPDIKEAHCASFIKGSADAHLEKILGQKFTHKSEVQDSQSQFQPEWRSRVGKEPHLPGGFSFTKSRSFSSTTLHRTTSLPPTNTASFTPSTPPLFTSLARRASSLPAKQAGSHLFGISTLLKFSKYI